MENQPKDETPQDILQVDEVFMAAIKEYPQPNRSEFG